MGSKKNRLAFLSMPARASYSTRGRAIIYSPYNWLLPLRTSPAHPSSPLVHRFRRTAGVIACVALHSDSSRTLNTALAVRREKGWRQNQTSTLKSPRTSTESTADLPAAHTKLLVRKLSAGKSTERQIRAGAPVTRRARGGTGEAPHCAPKPMAVIHRSKMRGCCRYELRLRKHPQGSRCPDARKAKDR